MLRQLLCTVFSTLVAANAFAYSYTVSFDTTGTTWNTSALAGYMTTGSNMAGMKVTATFADDMTQTALWAASGANSGGVNTSFFTLSEDGDTTGSLWTLRIPNDSTGGMLKSLKIDAGAGDTVFDAVNTPEKSVGSGLGLPFNIYFTTNNMLDVHATYSGPVSIANVNYGDLYRYLTLDFTGRFGANDSLYFKTDTDNLQKAGDIKSTNPDPEPDTPVPEPSTLILLLAGLTGMVMWRHQKK